MASIRRGLICFWILFSFCSIAVAQEEVEYKGEPGIWFPSEIAHAMLADIKDYNLVKPEIGLLKDRLEIRAERIEFLKEEVSLATAAADKAESVLSAAIKREREAKEELDAWYRSPILWVAAGVVVTVGLEVAAVYLFDSVAN